jgi:hypothetical protein
MAGIRQCTLEQPLAMAPANIPSPAGDDEERERIEIAGILKTCGVTLTAGNFAAADVALEKLFYLGSPVGRPFQRVAAAFVYALASRVHKFSLLPPPPPAEVHAAWHEFVATCPLLGFIAATAANKAIFQAMEGERRVHVVDLGGANTTQWLELIRLFSARPGGAPRLRFTIVSDDDAFIINAGSVLFRVAFRLQVPFLFMPVSTNIDRFSTADVAALGVERGEALAITSTLQLHRLIADVTTIDLPVPDDAAHGKKGKNKAAAQPSQQIITMADALLRVLYDVAPKVMVLTEQEANHNASNLQDRICNSFDYYAELFSNLEAGSQSSVKARRRSGEAAPGGDRGHRLPRRRIAEGMPLSDGKMDGEDA